MNRAASRAPNRPSSACASRLLKWISGALVLVLSVALGSVRTAAADKTLHLTADDISALYGRWETMIGNSDTPTVMRVRARTITVGGNCPTAYKVLDVRKRGTYYIVEIQESKPAILGEPTKGMPGCLSNGSPFVAWRLLSSMPSDDLPPITEFACQSYKDLRAIEANPMANVHCGLGGLSWSPLGAQERP